MVPNIHVETHYVGCSESCKHTHISGVRRCSSTSHLGGVGQPDRISFKPCMEFVNLHIQDMTTLYHMFWDGHHPYGFQNIYFMYSKEAQERVAR
jgi:hypothetical protein